MLNPWAAPGSPSDSMNVITTMQDEVHSAGVAAAIFRDCYFVSREFAKVEFVHENREPNTVAHKLSFLPEIHDSRTWLDDPPRSEEHTSELQSR